MNILTLIIVSVLLVVILLLSKRKETFGTDDEIYFTSFADTKYKATLDRIKNEAESLNIFKTIYTYDENTIDLSKHKKFIDENQRGYGYWIWKPKVILDTLNSITDGSFLVYADAGCTIKNDAEAGIRSILDKIDEKGLVAFSWNGTDTECKWSKMDTIKKIGINHDDKIALICTYIYFKKNENSINFVKEWLEICESDDYKNINDTQSNEQNCKEFSEHRHDQSIFSLLCHKYGIKVIGKDDETNPIIGTRLKF